LTTTPFSPPCIKPSPRRAERDESDVGGFGMGFAIAVQEYTASRCQITGYSIPLVTDFLVLL
jgi:hypothetical protein